MSTGFQLRTITALEAIKNSLVGTAEVDLRVMTGTLATGGPPLVFASGATADPMGDLTNSEALSMRWNNHAAPTALWLNAFLPTDINTAYPITLSFIGSKSGATSGDAVTLLVAAYITKSGDLHDADANCGGTTGAFVGAATAKTTATVTLAIAAADIAASLPSGGPGLLRVSVKPTDGTLGTDDFMLHSVTMSYYRRAV